MMDSKSKKAKGARLDNYVVDYCKQNLDIKTYATKGSGSTNRDKSDVRCPTINVMFEDKNHQQLSILNWIDQLEKDENDFNLSVLNFRNPRRSEAEWDVWSVIRFTDLVDLLANKESEIVVEKVDNKQLQWALGSLKQAINKVLRMIK